MKTVNYSEWKSGDFFTAPVGSHPAIIVWIAELWTAMSNYWKDDREQDLIRIFFEIEADVDVSKEDEDTKIESRIFITEQNYTCTVTDKSNLWKMIAGAYWKQAKEIKGFTLDKLLWKKCVINITHNEKWYSKVESTSIESKKMNYHEQKEANFYFWLNEKEFIQEKFDSLAPFVKTRIEESKEYRALFGVVSLDEQEEELKKEAEANKKAPTVWEEELDTLIGF